jgi:pyruvate-formate lyase-activating enzyme
MPRLTGRARDVTVDGLLDDVRRVAPFLSGVTVSGGEATLQAAFVAAFFEALGRDPATASLTRYVDSNGCADAATWDMLLPVTDGVMLDLKALDCETHLALTHHSNAPVLMSLHHLAAAGKLAEVRLLIVPGYNDSEDALRDTGDYLAEHAPGVPVRIIGFRPHGVRAAARDIPEATTEERERYASWVATSVGADLVSVV